MWVSCTRETASEQYVSLLLLQASYSVLRQRRINASPKKTDRRIDRQINREDLAISACILHLLLLAEAETERIHKYGNQPTPQSSGSVRKITVEGGR